MSTLTLVRFLLRLVCRVSSTPLSDLLADSVISSYKMETTWTPKDKICEVILVSVLCVVQEDCKKITCYTLMADDSLRSLLGVALCLLLFLTPD